MAGEELLSSFKMKICLQWYVYLVFKQRAIAYSVEIHHCRVWQCCAGCRSANYIDNQL